VEDAHWADLPSLQALLFALRPLQRDRILAIVSARTGDGPTCPRLSAAWPTRPVRR